jgi:transposase InsO family protein
MTTDSKHALPVAENLLKRDFSAHKANGKGASDITYLRTGGGWVGWCMQASLDRFLVLDALQSALGHRRPEAGLIHHSDPVTCGDWGKPVRQRGFPGGA